MLLIDAFYQVYALLVAYIEHVGVACVKLVADVSAFLHEFLKSFRTVRLTVFRCWWV